MMLNLNVNISTISKLTEQNFVEWLVNTRVHLCWSKLWKYTQKNASKKIKIKNKWKKTADLMMLTLSAEIKRKLTEKNFNNKYKMLTKLSQLLQFSDETQFMHLNHEYYILWYNDHDSEFMSDFLMCVKVLEECIDSTNIQMNNNKQTLLCLSMSLSVRYCSLIQIWNVTDDMMTEKTMKMMLKKDLQTVKKKEKSMKIVLTEQNDKKTDETCWHCKKKRHRWDNCYVLHSEKKKIYKTRRYNEDTLTL